MCPGHGSLCLPVFLVCCMVDPQNSTTLTFSIEASEFSSEMSFSQVKFHVRCCQPLLRHRFQLPPTESASSACCCCCSICSSSSGFQKNTFIMLALIPWCTRESKCKKGDPKDKERKALVNCHKQMKFGEMNKIKMASEPDCNIIPFTRFRIMTDDNMSELAVLHLQDRDKWEDFHFPKHKCVLKQEIQKIFASHDLNLLPFPEFHANWLLTSLTHQAPENWCCKPGMITMGFMPPDLLDSVQLFLCGNNNFNIRRANNNCSNISHVAKKDKGSGWHVCPMQQEGLSLDCRTQIFTKAFSEMVIKNLEHKVSPAMFSKVNQKHALIGTTFAAEQDPHCDFTDEKIATKTLVAHAPLATEGAVASVFDPDHNTHHCVHIPFSTFLVMHGDVWHSSFHGRAGWGRAGWGRAGQGRVGWGSVQQKMHRSWGGAGQNLHKPVVRSSRNPRMPTALCESSSRKIVSATRRLMSHLGDPRLSPQAGWPSCFGLHTSLRHKEHSTSTMHCMHCDAHAATMMLANMVSLLLHAARLSQSSSAPTRRCRQKQTAQQSNKQCSQLVSFLRRPRVDSAPVSMTIDCANDLNNESTLALTSRFFDLSV